jgi:hypothetical protein
MFFFVKLKNKSIFAYRYIEKIIKPLSFVASDWGFNLKIMKRFNSQSVARKVKRGHVKFELSEFIKDKDGKPLLVKKVRTKRGKWMLA